MKNDYNKNYFWTTVDPETGKRSYFFKINGVMVEVSREVYNVCFSSYAKMLRDSRRDEKANLMSLDQTNEEGHALIDILSSNDLVESEAYRSILVEQIKQEIDQLTDEEKKILFELLVEEKPIRQLAREMGIPTMTLHDRKQRLLKKLKNKLNK